MSEIMLLAAVPVGEECEQVGEGYRRDHAIAECQAFIRQLQRIHGEPPKGAALIVKANAHDFGVYHEVAVLYDPNDEKSIDYAFHLERNLPEFWDEEARRELKLPSIKAEYWTKVSKFVEACLAEFSDFEDYHRTQRNCEPLESEDFRQALQKALSLAQAKAADET